MRKDYYAILGITDEEKKLQGEEFNKVVKKKYRQIAIKNHPDRVGDKSPEEKKKCEEIFKDAAEANEVLSDPQKRAEYDNPASDFQFSGNVDIDEILRRMNAGGFNPFGGNPFDMFDEMRGFHSQPQEVVGSDVRIVIPLTLEEMFNGAKKKFRYKRYGKCETCGGSGRTKDSKEEACPHCHGTGQIFRQQGFMQMVSTCPHCGGEGKTVKNPCKKCGGQGVVLTPNEVEIEIPKGLSSDMQLTIPDGGNYPGSGTSGKYGRLIVAIKEQPHPVFTRRGDDLYFKLDVPVLDAILGCEREVVTIDNKKLSVKLQSGVNDGDNIRIKNYGMPVIGTERRGNMIGVVNVIMPKSLTDEEREKLEELKEMPNFKK